MELSSSTGGTKRSQGRTLLSGGTATNARARSVSEVRVRSEEALHLPGHGLSEAGNADPPAFPARHPQRQLSQGPDAGAAQDGRYARQEPTPHVVAYKWLRDGRIAQRLDGLRDGPRRSSPLAGWAREMPRQVVTLTLGCKRSDLTADGADHRARGGAGSNAGQAPTKQIQ